MDRLKEERVLTRVMMSKPLILISKLSQLTQSLNLQEQVFPEPSNYIAFTFSQFYVRQIEKNIPSPTMVERRGRKYWSQLVSVLISWGFIR